ncbi:MAG: tRNA (adenosine(37)-N6)-threonylcarbamoyltransferase complex transferase subunit TsaD [Bacteroidales bacterium]|nr:tRNA (adenosine(37)-N6)-threonylcarbamoyltransferase complex transferase subunit TsaD [Bacteroidales bacterium]
MSDIILGIESSCDDTSAAVLRDEYLLSSVIASQKVHQVWGGVVPELASRAHLMNIVPVVDQALKGANVTMDEVDAIAFTRGPGLLGSLLVGTSFAKGLAISSGKKLVDVNHLQGHILSCLVKQVGKETPSPTFPFLTLLVSGGHTQIVRVDGHFEFEILGQTIDDAVGEAFDKCSKMMGLGYPGGPIVDKLAKEGDPLKFKFNLPNVGGLDYSFSGIKTSLLYFLRDRLKENPNFIEENKADICASFQKALIDILMKKLILAVKQTGIKQVSIGGGVSANSGLRERVEQEGKKRGWQTFIPEFKFTTDNAAMIAISGLYKYRRGEFCSLERPSVPRASAMNPSQK